MRVFGYGLEGGFRCARGIGGGVGRRREEKRARRPPQAVDGALLCCAVEKKAKKNDRGGARGGSCQEVDHHRARGDLVHLLFRGEPPIWKKGRKGKRVGKKENGCRLVHIWRGRCIFPFCLSLRKERRLFRKRGRNVKEGAPERERKRKQNLRT